MKKVTDNKYFWKTIKANFTNKILKDEKIILVEDDKVVTTETDLPKIFKDHFEKITIITFILNVLVKSTLILTYSVVRALKSFSQRILLKRIKTYDRTVLPASMTEQFFPEQLKYADVKPVFKKDSRNCKRNYKSFNILSNISKI